MNFIDSFCNNIKKMIALIALMLLLTLVILIFTHTSLGYFLVLLPILLLILYLLHGTSTKTARNGRKTKAAEQLNNLGRRSYAWASFFHTKKRSYQSKTANWRLVETRRIELLTPCLQGRCSPS